MRRAFVAASWLCVFACGARSEIAGSDLEEDDDAADATLDVVVHADGGPHADAAIDAIADAPLDASPDTELCCDLGFKQAGCHACASGETCITKTGSCSHDVPKCGPSNCKGCCWGLSTCSDGTEVGACGTGGQLCQTCFDSKNEPTSCVSDGGSGGTCAGGPTCTAQNCAEGCCSGDICMTGDLDSFCGHAATVCSDCTKLSGFCDGGVCQLPHQ